MTALTPYLLFDGHCREAMEFYQSCFAGELTVTKVKDPPAKDHVPAVQQDKVIYARLRSPNVEIRLRTGFGSGELPFAATPFVCTSVEAHSRASRLYSKDRTILWYLRGAQRQAWCSPDVSNR